MTKYILRQLKRSIVHNSAFCLLMALAGTLLCLGAGLLVTAVSSAREADDAFTTIALPHAATIQQYYRSGYMLETESALFNDPIMNTIAEKIYASGEFDMDRRRIFGGYSDGIMPHMPDGYPITLPNSTAAFIAVAETVELIYYSDRTYGSYSHEVISVKFSVEDTLLIHPSHTIDGEPINSFNIRLVAQPADGTSLIEEGKRYFVLGRGFSKAYSMLFPPGGPTGTGVYFSYSWLELEPADTAGSYRRVWRDDPFNDPYLEFARFDTGFPWLIELPGDASVPIPDEFQSEIDEVVSVGEKSVGTVIVMTTNRLDSYFWFHQNRANISEGRAFSREELETGANVILINELTEGVSVGDKITLQLYETTVTAYSGEWTIRQPYSPVSLESEPIEYEVIGKFSVFPKDKGDYTIPSNAVIVPDNSIPEFPFIVPEITDSLQQSLDENGVTFDEWLALKWGLDSVYIPVQNTIIIPNGEIDAFASKIYEMLPEYAAFFRIYDQGYGNISGALDNLQNSGRLIVMLCLVGWLVALLVFCLFYVLKKRKDAGLLYALGVKKKHRFKWLFVQCLIVVFMSQVIAFGAASLLYDGTVAFAVKSAQSTAEERVAMFSDAIVTSDINVREFTIKPNPCVIPVTVAGQLAVMLIITGAMSAAIVSRGTVSLRKGGED